jgi:hypothetical protein
VITRAQQIERETNRVRAFQREANAVARLILNTDLPWVDVAIQIERLRTRAERCFPGKNRVFNLVYVSRFRRLWQQWRGDSVCGNHETGP